MSSSFQYFIRLVTNAPVPSGVISGSCSLVISVDGSLAGGPGSGDGVLRYRLLASSANSWTEGVLGRIVVCSLKRLARLGYGFGGVLIRASNEPEGRVGNEFRRVT
jgi:hypothetical protein